MIKLMQCQKVKEAILRKPFLLPLYYEKPFNPELTNYILKKMVNRSIGLEIECCGSLLYQFIDKNDPFDMNAYPELNNRVMSYYNIMDYHEDRGKNIYNIKIANNPYHDDSGFNEHVIRISDYKQILGLYELLNDMKKYCRINKGSGIHVNVDLNDIVLLINKSYSDPRDIAKEQIQNLLKPKLDYIEQIFFPGSHHTGEYNSKRVSVNTKGGWVNIRQKNGSFNTCVEFRIAPQTFDYATIMKWIVDCTKLINWVKNQIIKETKSIPKEMGVTYCNTLEEVNILLQKFKSNTGRQHEKVSRDAKTLAFFVYSTTKYHILDNGTFCSERGWRKIHPETTNP